MVAFFANQEKAVSKLCAWLKGQHPGLNTFKAFRQRALDCAADDADHRALYRLLAGLAEEHVSRYDEDPLPVELAEQIYRRLIKIVADAEGSVTAPASEQIQALNELAAQSLV
jgi:hypothetical protein